MVLTKQFYNSQDKVINTRNQKKSQNQNRTNPGSVPSYGIQPGNQYRVYSNENNMAPGARTYGASFTQVNGDMTHRNQQKSQNVLLLGYHVDIGAQLNNTNYIIVGPSYKQTTCCVVEM